MPLSTPILLFQGLLYLESQSPAVKTQEEKMKRGVDDSRMLTLLVPTNHISKLTGPYNKMKNNTESVKYAQNKQAAKGSAEIKLPDGEKDVLDICHKKTYLNQTKFTEDLGSKAINAQTRLLIAQSREALS